MRNGKYVDFTPVPVSEYFQLDSVCGEYFDGEKYCDIEITPCPEDLQYLRTFKFEDLTYRGTIEFRSSCCQPISESMTVAAFHAGLMENLPRLKEMLDSDRVIYGHGYTASELQRMFSMREIPSFADKGAVSENLTEILRLAEEGLKKRGFGEETLLAPLYDRARKLTNPAKKMLEGMARGETLEHYIGEYARV
jgi:gamma-glutamylcysteine synthetase